MLGDARLKAGVGRVTDLGDTDDFIDDGIWIGDDAKLLAEADHASLKRSADEVVLLLLAIEGVQVGSVQFLLGEVRLVCELDERAVDWGLASDADDGPIGRREGEPKAAGRDPCEGRDDAVDGDLDVRPVEVGDGKIKLLLAVLDDVDDIGFVAH